MKLQADFCPESASNEMQKHLQVHREFINQAPVAKELKESAGFKGDIFTRENLKYQAGSTHVGRSWAH